MQVSGGLGEPLPHPRAVLDGVLSTAECGELVMIARAFGVVGYRTAVASATCFELASAEPALLLPLVSPCPAQRCLQESKHLRQAPVQMAAREKVRSAAEEGLGLELGQLWVEFTGLISWRRGAAIDFHSDDNRWDTTCLASHHHALSASCKGCLPHYSPTHVRNNPQATAGPTLHSGTIQR